MKNNIVLKDDIISLLRGAGLVFIFAFLGSVLGYFVQILLARWLGPADFGTYRYAITWCGLLATLATLGFDVSSPRYISQYLHEETTEKLRGFVFGTPLLVLVAGTGLTVLGITFVLVFRQAIETAYAAPITVALFAIPALAIVDLQRSSLRAFRWILLADVPSSLIRPALFMTLVTVSYYTFPILTPTTVAGAFVLAAIVVAMIQAVGFRRRLNISLRKVNPVHRYSEWLRVSMPMLYGRVFFILFQRADIVLIGIILGPESVGLYAVAHTTAGLISFGIGAVVALARPTVASLYHQDRREDLQSTLSILANLTFWPCTILVAGLIWYGDFVLHLFGERYVVSHTVLGVLAVGRLLNVAGGLVGVLLNMTGHQTMVARVYGWSAGINATLNLIGIYYFGIIGAAVVTALTVVFWNIWLNIYCARQTNFHPSILFPLYRKLLASGDSLK